MGKKGSDLIGQHINRWTVLKEAETMYGSRMWLCQCDCGTIKTVRDYSLRNGISKSCGCYSREVRSDATIDLKGMTFGRLTVLHRANVKNGSNVHWVCQCECGKIKTVSGDSLRRGLTKSCGCLQKEISTQTGRNSFVDLRSKRFGKLIVLSDTGRRHGKNIIWHCRCDCGNYTDVPGGGLQSGDTSSCGHCNLNSNGEMKIMAILTENNIPYLHDTSLLECRYPDTGGLARFDFYVNDAYVIEYDGIQHFSAERGNWGDPTYISTQKSHDLYKNLWCSQNNIPIIRIPYTHYNNLRLEDLSTETSLFLLNNDKGR